MPRRWGPRSNVKSMPPTFARYVALGDSQTEGLNDRDPEGNLLGWADRFAQTLAATTSPDLRYANLAVRGCRARHVRGQQLDAALAMEPDLVTVAVGMNDVLRHDFDLDQTVQDIGETFAELRLAGCTVLTMTFPDLARMLPVMTWLRPREIALNERILELAEKYDVPVLDVFPLAMCSDPRLWSKDRIHGSTEGHTRIAAGMAELLGLPGVDPGWSDMAPGAVAPRRLDVVRRDAWWAVSFVLPWLARQARRQRTGPDLAKRPELLPVRPDQ